MAKKETNVIRVDKFVRGKSIFASTGISRVKVTKDGKVCCLEIPIKSSGISELIDSFQRLAPSPPAKSELVKPGSEIAKELGITTKQWVKVPDYSDSHYLKEKEEHNSNLGMAVALHGIAVALEDENGKEIKEEKEKIKLLKEMGLSGEQFSKIVEDITALTKWQDEEETSFLD